MRLLVVFLTLLFVSCTGYQLNGAKPAALKDVESIAVPMFKNDTLHPRAESLATSALTESIVRDGTYRLSNQADADAILEGTVYTIEYTQIRGTRLDTLRPEELQNTVTIRWILRDAADPNRILANGTSAGVSRFFVDSNLQTARNSALPSAFEEASDALVSRIANGF